MVPVRYSQHGFAIQGIHITGGVMAFQDLWLQWRVDKLEDVTPKELALIQLMKPLPELVVFGVGPQLTRLPETLTEWLKQQGLDVEVLPTPSAVATFNILNREGRSVVAALLPIEPLADEA